MDILWNIIRSKVMHPKHLFKLITPNYRSFGTNQTLVDTKKQNYIYIFVNGKLIEK